MKIKLFQVDAFADKLFSGNPAAVCPLKDWLPDSILQNIAIENNLSETAFFIPNENGFDLRWFTPGFEVDLCGHATLATAHVLFKHLGYEKEEIEFQTRSGKLNVKREQAFYTMDFPVDTIQEVKCPEIIQQALNTNILESYKGKDDYLIVVKNQETVANLKPDFGALKKLKTRGVIVTAPGDEVDFISRGFFPYAGIDEDPVTGSAHTTLTPYWAKRTGKSNFRAKQISARGGELKCVSSGNRVKISGTAITFLIGEFEI